MMAEGHPSLWLENQFIPHYVDPLWPQWWHMEFTPAGILNMAAQMSLCEHVIVV